MGNPAPPIDQRTAQDVVAQVKRLVNESYMPDRPDLFPPHGVSAALIGIFGRFAEIIISRLNKVPEKNVLAFMDLLGASLLPPQPARVPLLFSPAAGSAADGVVPARTQVAAQPAEGETQPVIFETERELVVTAAQLSSIFVRDPGQDKYSDCSTLTTDRTKPGLPPFQGSIPTEHLLYLGQSRLLGLPNIAGLTLKITFATAPQNELKLSWEFWDGAKWLRQDPRSDQTVNAVRTITFAAIAPVPLVEVDGDESRWLRGRLLNPISPASGPLPDIKAVTLSLDIGRGNLTADAAFSNQLPVDLSRDFYPFGEKPKFGDTLYLANFEAFSEKGATLTLAVTLTNPKDASADPPLPKTKADGNPKLAWEFWDGKTWAVLGTAVSNQDTNVAGFVDTTQALTKSGNVTMTLPRQSAAVAVNGTENFWLRVRLVSGNYGEEARYVKDSSEPSGYRLDQATFAPPSINAIKIGYTLPKTPTPPERVKTYNDFAYATVQGPSFSPFQSTQDTRPTLYFGFNLPAAKTAFPNHTLSLYLRVWDVMYGAQPDNPAPEAPPRLIWEMGTERAWTKLTVRDETQGMTRSGLVEFLPPADTAMRSEFGVRRHWLRARWESGGYRFVPKVQRVLLNTTMATQAESVSREILGSSDGGANQRFQTTRKPILEGPLLDVREPEIPSAGERAVLEEEAGADAVSVVFDAAGRPAEIWVRWREAPDFYGSGPRSRHYVLNHLTGEIRFGDGLRGLIPPLGAANVRMTLYQTGGGVAGNKPEGAIVQLRTTIPYVDKVMNPGAASGGADAELLESLLDRAPRTIRHRGRAVTMEDYEDLALQTSSEVVRAKCVPMRNLMDDPYGEKSAVPGTVSVIIVPRSEEVRPQPRVELVRRVQDYIENRSVPTATVFVVGPLYIRVDVTAEIALTSLDAAGEVERAVYQSLVDFLHPLSGGLDGAGWSFGREPHASDLYALLGSVPGVDHVNSLTTLESACPQDIDLEKVRKTGRFLVYSGTHDLRLVFEGS